MNEKDFFKKLEERAEEQEQILTHMPLQKSFMLVSLWLGRHPWRILIPAAALLTLLFRLVLGYHYYEIILKIFGGFGIVK